MAQFSSKHWKTQASTFRGVYKYLLLPLPLVLHMPIHIQIDNYLNEKSLSTCTIRASEPTIFAQLINFLLTSMECIVEDISRFLEGIWTWSLDHGVLKKKEIVSGNGLIPASQT